MAGGGEHGFAVDHIAALVLAALAADAGLGARRGFDHFHRAEGMAKLFHGLSLDFLANGASIGLDAVFRAGRRSRYFSLIPLVAGGGDGLGLSLVANGAGVGLDAVLGAGRLGRYLAVVPLMAGGGEHGFAVDHIAALVLAALAADAGLGARRGFDHFHHAEGMAELFDDLGFGFLADSAGEGLFAILLASRFGRYFAVIQLVIQIMYGDVLERIDTTSSRNFLPIPSRAAGVIYILQTGAAIKGVFSNVCHALRNGNFRQCIAAVKSVLSDDCRTFCNRDACKFMAVLESAHSHVCNTAEDLNARKARAAVKSRASYTRYARRDRNACQTAAQECISSDAYYTFRNRYACQRRDGSKGVLPDALDSCRNRDIRKIEAEGESIITDTCRAVADLNRFDFVPIGIPRRSIAAAAVTRKIVH